MKIGIWGNGFVGGAVAAFFRSREEVCVWDINPDKRVCSLPDILGSDIVFLCLPTPTNPDGTQNQAALMNAVETIHESRQTPTVVIKSTVLPGTTARLALHHPQLRFVFNPEFLTARTAEYDFAHPTSIVLGGGPRKVEQESLDEVMFLHTKYFPGIPLIRCDHTTAELVKYTRNSYYAAKVAFFNEVARLCRTLGVDYERVRQGVVTSPWVDGMHTFVPGPDGHLGFGGACLPKDSQALVRFAQDHGAGMPTLEAAIKSNKKVRGEG